MDLSMLGLYSATRGLSAAQQALNTVGHNIANANTEGYSRQRVTMSPTTPFTAAGFNTPIGLGQLGSGVQIDTIRRMRDEFLDLQIRQETSLLGQDQATYDVVTQIEGLFAEPSDTGLSKVLDNFFNSWQELSLNPESAASRGVVRERALTLVAALTDLEKNLNQIRGEIDQQIKTRVNDVNAYLKDIAELNDKIADAQVTGVSPNNLLDQRDLVLEKLSKLVDVQVNRHEDGRMWVYLNGRALVEGNTVTPLSTAPNAEGPFSDVLYQGQPLVAGSMIGSLGSLMRARDQIIGRSAFLPPVAGVNSDGVLGQIDKLANAVVQRVNALHRAGTVVDNSTSPPTMVPSNEDFFVHSSDPMATAVGAGAIALNPLIANGTAGLAAIATGSPTATGPGDNGTAIAIARLRVSTANGATLGSAVSFEDYYRNFLAALGIQGQASERNLANKGALIEHLNARRQENSGVNLDEEMADMVRYQHAYQASARVLNTFDQLLDTIINGLGRVGR